MARAKLEEEKTKVIDGAVEKYTKARKSTSIRNLPEEGKDPDWIL